MSIGFNLKLGEDKERSDKWTVALEEFLEKDLKDLIGDQYEGQWFTDVTFRRGTQKQLHVFTPFLFITSFLMTGYALVWLFSQTRQRQGKATQVQLVTQG